MIDPRENMARSIHFRCWSTCKRHARCADNDKHAHAGLCLKAPAKRAAADHQCADIADQDEQDDDVAVDAAEGEKLVSNDGDELEDHEKASWKDSAMVERDPYSIGGPCDTSTIRRVRRCLRSCLEPSRRC